MDKCNLCKKNDADKKGSHIVPHFLLKRIENIDGKTGRDFEIGYKIERLKSESHFGRSVQLEKLEETYGEITDDDIDNNKHPLIVDYFLCSYCEERFAQIESKYSQTIKTVENVEYKSGISNSNGILFWASVLWRMSVHGESGVKLTTKQNELFRKKLDSFLPDKNEKLNEKLFAESSLVKKISYKIVRCHNCRQDEAKWLLFHPEFYNSLCLFIDEFVIAFSLNGQYDEFKTKDCFGINDLILNAPTNSVGSNEVIKPFDRSIFIEFSKKIVTKIRDVYVGGLDEFFDKAHVDSGGMGDKMPVELKQEIMAEITSDEKKIGRKYTQDEIVKSTYKVMKKYSP
ncbi:MAG: hypothetical protein COA31_006885 [Flavobacteriales bacterium]|nr:hypothetical protein [Flavobacteriales bacterium]